MSAESRNSVAAQQFLLKKLAGTPNAPASAQRILLVGPTSGFLASDVAALGHRAVSISRDPKHVVAAKRLGQTQGQDGQILGLDPLQDSLWERAAEEVLGGMPQQIWLIHELETSPWPEALLDRFRQVYPRIPFWVVVGRRGRPWQLLLEARGWRVQVRRFAHELVLGPPDSLDSPS